MKLIGNLKNQVEKAKDKDEARKFISEACMELTTDELEMVTGGGSTGHGAFLNPSDHGLNPRDELEIAEYALHCGEWRNPSCK
jgi:hypothetical protein